MIQLLEMDMFLSNRDGLIVRWLIRCEDEKVRMVPKVATFCVAVVDIIVIQKKRKQNANWCCRVVCQTCVNQTQVDICK
ncbi:unnamed protein product [Brugia timori]|uniref:Uncharacterized protein n=1 Tax=Brugia timori TaxID=42155 RepID=A0A0R3R3T0_9BILA|nr:unnamed protein product [Brugia timori]